MTTFSIAIAGWILLKGVEGFLVAPRASPATAIHATTERREFLAVGAMTLIPTNAALAAEDNEFIKELKARSDANRDAYNRQARTTSKLDSSMFASQYQRPKFIGIRRMDGSFKMVAPDVLDDLEAKGLVIAEYDTHLNKDGEVVVEYKKGKVYQYASAEAQDKAESKPAPAPVPTTEPVAFPEPEPVTVASE